MKKQPYLTDFPTTIFATAKRRSQAAIREFLSTTNRCSLSGYAVLFGEFLTGDFLTSIDPTKRKRAFGHLPVFWAWLAQILEGNASCSRGLSLIQNWCRLCKIPVPSSDTSSYCKARHRIRLSFLKAIHRQVLQTLSSRVSNGELWQGLRLKAIDGSSVQLMDTDANQRAYPQPSVQKEGCGFPTMGLVGLLDLAHGGWEHVKTCRHNRHDSRAAGALIQHLTKGDLLLADRAFCSYELLARSLSQGAHCLFRLHQARHRALRWKEGKRIGKHQRIVVWKRPQYPENGSLSRAQWKHLPKLLELRLIKLRYESRSGELKELVVVTTLLDNDKHDGCQLADLYARRWEIEVRLRDLKTTLGMETFAVKSPRMAHKTLWMSLIAYNLIRALMQKAAFASGSPNRTISFKGTLDLVVSSHESFRNYAGKPRLLKQARSELLEIIASKLLDIRSHRKEPRAIKRRPKAYQYLSKHRHEFVEIPHRSRYRKPA